jgi:hypothetical protein
VEPLVCGIVGKDRRTLDRRQPVIRGAQGGRQRAQRRAIQIAPGTAPAQRDEQLIEGDQAVEGYHRLDLLGQHVAMRRCRRQAVHPSLGLEAPSACRRLPASWCRVNGNQCSRER